MTPTLTNPVCCLLRKVVTGAALMDYGLTVSGMEGVEASEIVWVDAQG